MSKAQFEAELKQWQAKLLILYQEGQQLFLRHGAEAPHAATKVMPHLEQARKGTDRILMPDAPPPTE